MSQYRRSSRQCNRVMFDGEVRNHNRLNTAEAVDNVINFECLCVDVTKMSQYRRSSRQCNHLDYQCFSNSSQNPC